MFAIDAVVGGGTADVGEGEVDFVVDTLHDGEDECAEGMLYMLISTNVRFPAVDDDLHECLGTCS